MGELPKLLLVAIVATALAVSDPSCPASHCRSTSTPMREGTAGARPPAVHLLASLAARLWWQLSLRQEPRSRASCSLSRLSVSLISKRKRLTACSHTRLTRLHNVNELLQLSLVFSADALADVRQVGVLKEAGRDSLRRHATQLLHAHRHSPTKLCDSRVAPSKPSRPTHFSSATPSPTRCVLLHDDRGKGNGRS